jgi:outer membrane protein assembly factor BamB
MILRTLVLAIVIMQMFASPVSAKIKDPEPLLVDGVEYSAHASKVTAVQKATGAILWKVVLPVQWEREESNNIEADAQWNIITELRLLDSGELLVRFRQGNVFGIDRKTGEWRELPHLPRKTEE